MLHIYGAYVPKHISEMHSEKEGFLIKGWAADVKTAMQQARVCLAPLRFGAGLKGKLLDAALYGTPAVTSPIGGEGMFSIAQVRDQLSEFVETALVLYSDKTSWQVQQKKGFETLEQYFSKAKFSTRFFDTLATLQRQLPHHRQAHFIGQILQHQTLQATKFMSKWIEEKNQK
ncbi:MAG: glycosyltransferase [Flavobacteriaceae bacterium]